MLKREERLSISPDAIPVPKPPPKPARMRPPRRTMDLEDWAALDESRTSSGSGNAIFAICDFTPSGDGDELRLEKNKTYVAEMRINKNWWRGHDPRTGSSGIFPTAFVEWIGRESVTRSGSKGDEQSSNSCDLRRQRRLSKKELRFARIVQVHGDTSGPVASAAPAQRRRRRSLARVVKFASSPSRWSVWAHFTAMYAGLFFALTGVGLVLWAAAGFSPGFGGHEPKRAFRSIDTAIGIYAIVVGTAIFGWEKRRGIARAGRSRVPFYSFAWALSSLPGYFAVPTGYGASFLCVPCFLEARSCWLLETIDAPQAAPKSGSSRGEEAPIWQRFLRLVGGKNPEGREGRIRLFAIFFIVNIAYGTYNAMDAARKIADKTLPETFTVWVPVAKFFGAVMNVNFTIILLPVTHCLINLVTTTASEGKTLRAALFQKINTWIPPDQALKFHKLCGFTGGIAAIVHTVAHVLNYAMCADAVWETFGIGIWITGWSLTLIMLLMYTAALPQVKRGHHELFHNSHLLYIPFFLLNIVHGKNWLGPNFWKLFVVPGGLFFVDRIYMNYVAYTSVCNLVSATFMSTDVLEIAFSKSGNFETYHEGQYAFICCPTIAKHEWHPSTLTRIAPIYFANLYDYEFIVCLRALLKVTNIVVLVNRPYCLFLSDNKQCTTGWLTHVSYTSAGYR